MKKLKKRSGENISNASLMIEESQLSGDILVRKIDEVLNNKSLILDMKSNLKKIKVVDSATIIYNNLKKLVDRK